MGIPVNARSRAGGFIVKTFLAAVVAFALISGLSTELRAANIVSNPGFETGDFTSWTTAGWTVNFGPGPSSKVPNSGSYYAYTGCVGSECITTPSAYIYQDLSTIAGDSYTLSFYFSSEGAPMELQALFGGVIAFDLVDLPVDSGYQFYSTALTATGTTTRLEFLGRQDPAWDALDDISVADNGAGGGGGTPEPATWMRAGPALIAVSARRRRSRS